MGVLQGSVLRPLLLLLLIKDLPEFVHPELLIMFAVHGGLSSEFCGTHCNVVSGLSSWCRSNALFLNVEKTECIYFSNKNVYVKRMIISCSGREIVSKESIKFLGIHLDHLLKWGFYVDSVSKRLSSSLYTVNRIKLSLHIESILNDYFSLV